MTAKILINRALKLNNKTISDLNMFKINSNSRWRAISAGKTSIEQIVTWSILALNTFISIVLLALSGRLYFRLYKANVQIQSLQKTNLPYEIDIFQRQIDKLASKVTALENDLLTIRMKENPCTDVALEKGDGAPAEDID